MSEGSEGRLLDCRLKPDRENEKQAVRDLRSDVRESQGKVYKSKDGQSILMSMS